MESPGAGQVQGLRKVTSLHRRFACQLGPGWRRNAGIRVSLPHRTDGLGPSQNRWPTPEARHERRTCWSRAPRCWTEQLAGAGTGRCGIFNARILPKDRRAARAARREAAGSGGGARAGIAPLQIWSRSGGPVGGPQPGLSRLLPRAMPPPVASRWPDAFGWCSTRQHDSTDHTCSDQAGRHGTARRGTGQHDRSRSRNA